MYLSRYKTNSMFHSYDTKYVKLFIAGYNTKLLEQSNSYSDVLVYGKLSNEIKCAVLCV